MATTVDNTASPRSAKLISKLSSPLSHVSGKQEMDGGSGDDDTFPSSPLDSSIPSKVLPGRSPRKPSVETQTPRFSEVLEHGCEGNNSEASLIARGKKQAWKVPSNSSIEVGSVMDAFSWPALNDSVRVSPKSSSSDSIKSLSDRSLSSPQGSFFKMPSNVQNLNSTLNPLTSRDKTMKCDPDTCSSSNNSISGEANFEPAMPSLSSVSTESSHSVHTKLPSFDNSLKGPPKQSSGNNDNERDRKAGQTFPHPHGGNDHKQSYGGGRKGSNGNRNSYGNRRDSERGGYEWNHRNFGRDANMQQLHQQQLVRPYLRPSSIAASPFITPPPLRPFANVMGFPDFPSPIYFVAAPSHPESFRGVPFTSHPTNAPPVMLFSAADPQRAMLLKQIDYYFSPENLCKDLFLRQNMDEQGWVPISVIANFNRVKQMTNSIQYLVDTVQLSNVVELQGDKIRKRHDWMAWVLLPAKDFSSASVLPSSTTNFDSLEDQFDNVYIDLDSPNNTGFRESVKNKVSFSRSASMNLNSQLSVSNSEDDDGQFGNYSNRVWNMRTLVRNDTM